MHTPATGQVPADRSNRWALGCVSLFALPFIASGALVVWTTWVHKGSEGGRAFWGPVLFGALFSVVGIGLIAGTSWAIRKASAEAARRAASPDQPWRWRDDWAAGYARDENAKSVAGLWVFSLLWTSISSMIFVPLSDEIQRNRMAWLALIFPGIGVLLIWACIYSTLRSRKYGRPTLQLNGVPSRMGGRFDSTLRARIAQPVDGFDVKFSNVRRYVQGTGKNASTHEEVLWEEKKVIPGGAMMPGSELASLPIAFAIPAGGTATDSTDQRNRKLWRIDVTAKMPGIDFSAQFEIPVF